MDPEDITIEVRSAALGRLGQVGMDYVNDLKITKRFNNVGSWTMSLPAEYSMAQNLAQKGRGLIVTYSKGAINRVLCSGPLTSFTKDEDSDDLQGTWNYIGADDNIHLGDALAWPQPSNPNSATQNVSNDIRTGDAESVLIGYVRDNIGSAAPAARHIAGLHESVNLSRGATVTGNARFDQLGKLLGDLASAGGLGFDLYQDSTTTKIFSVYQPQDKSSYIRMDIENDMLDKTSYGFGAPTGTRFIVAGQGEGTQRQMIQVNADPQVETDWGRIVEIFKDRRDTADPVELQQEGDQGVADNGRTITSLSVTPSDNVTMVYARDWFLGDIVGVVVDDEELTAVVTEAIIGISEDGVEVAATIGDPVGFDYESKLIQNQQSQETRIAFLEKNSEIGITEGQSALRDETYGVPATSLARLSLAVTQPIWRNTQTGLTERYYMSLADANGDPVAMANASPDGAGWYDNSKYHGALGRYIDLIGTLPTADWQAYTSVNGALSWSGNRQDALLAVRSVGGIVHLSAMMTRLTAAPSGTVIGQLPLGFRPDDDWYFGVNVSDTSGILNINAAGQIIAQQAIAAGQYVSFDNVAFPAAGVATWTPVDPQGTVGSLSAYANGWVKYSTNPGARWWKDPNTGLTWLHGLITNPTAGTWVDGNLLFTLPITHQSYLQQHHITCSSQPFGYIGTGVGSGPAVGQGANFKYAGGATSGWVSIDGAKAWTVDANSILSIWVSRAILNNGWGRNSVSQPPLQLGKAKDGLVYSSGLIAGGSFGTRALTPPRTYQQYYRSLRHVASSGSRGRMDFWGCDDQELYGTTGAAGSLKPTQGTTWMSFDSLVWFPNATTP